jgi:hypothetical protein
MPLLQLQTSAPTANGRAPKGLLEELSAILARELSKPEAYVMVSFEHRADMLFGGTRETNFFATLKNIGTFTPKKTQELSAVLCEKLSAALDVPSSRIYIEYVNAVGHLWGHDGETFA